MNDQELIPRLYRQEYSKMVSLLCTRFGIDQMDAAEDIVSETFLAAAETWGLKGVPDNPVAWLYKVAKNNALNGLKHERVVREHAKGVRGSGSAAGGEAAADRMEGGWGMDGWTGIDGPVAGWAGIDGEAGSWAGLDGEAGYGAAGEYATGGWATGDWDLSPGGINDSQLRMLFAVCHPAIPLEAQVSLALRVLCGFTIDEIAQALLTTKATINKRLYRGKVGLREAAVGLELPAGAALEKRLDAVLLTLYLLFNEGYYSSAPSKVLRKDLCLEAMRLCFLLTQHGRIARADVFSLLALMCFQASRFDARMDENGGLVLYEQQDSNRWDQELIGRGNGFMEQACGQELLSRYHFEAAIAWWHTQAVDSPEKWENILLLYNRLLVAQYSPIAALNRAYAFSRVYGKEKAIPEAEGLGLEGNLFYHSLLGELYSGVNDGKAIAHFERAMELAGTEAEKAVIAEKMRGCGG